MCVPVPVPVPLMSSTFNRIHSSAAYLFNQSTLGCTSLNLIVQWEKIFVLDSTSVHVYLSTTGAVHCAPSLSPNHPPWSGRSKEVQYPAAIIPYEVIQTAKHSFLHLLNTLLYSLGVDLFTILRRECICSRRQIRLAWVAVFDGHNNSQRMQPPVTSNYHCTTPEIVQKWNPATLAMDI